MESGLLKSVFNILLKEIKTTQYLIHEVAVHKAFTHKKKKKNLFGGPRIYA